MNRSSTHHRTIFQIIINLEINPDRNKEYCDPIQRIVIKNKINTKIFPPITLEYFKAVDIQQAKDSFLFVFSLFKWVVDLVDKPCEESLIDCLCQGIPSIHGLVTVQRWTHLVGDRSVSKFCLHFQVGSVINLEITLGPKRTNLSLWGQNVSMILTFWWSAKILLFVSANTRSSCLQPTTYEWQNRQNLYAESES